MVGPEGSYLVDGRTPRVSEASYHIYCQTYPEDFHIYCHAWTRIVAHKLSNPETKSTNRSHSFTLIIYDSLFNIVISILVIFHFFNHLPLLSPSVKKILLIDFMQPYTNYLVLHFSGHFLYIQYIQYRNWPRS